MYQSTLNGISNEHLYSKKVSSTKNIQCQICPVRTVRGSGKLTYSLNASKWCGLVTRVSFKVCTLRPSL